MTSAGPTIDPQTASAVVDLTALRANIGAVAALVAPADVMMVVKADAYGHGMLPCAAAAREAGASWLGVATPGEALALRAGGDTGRIFCWLYGIDEDLTALVDADVDVSASTPGQVNTAVIAAAHTERTARLHLKIDTGLSRNGCTPELWPELVAAALEAERAGAVEVVGVWSHFACADEVGHPGNAAQLELFDWAVEQARAAGLRVPVRHIAASAAALSLPESRYEMVRLGIAGYGIDPADGSLAADAGLELQPVMTLRAQLVHRKQVSAGTGVSYGYRWRAPEDTVLGLVPLGYADGLPRHGAGRLEMAVGGRRVHQRGSVCMDQVIVELGPGAADQIGDEVVLFGAPSEDGTVPTASDWARWCGTIGYEIVTRVGTRVPRVHRG
ncbi:alanine racemase [Raineyella antarctica]|uniref:Alanine racemase n=1 Tax=Raineyella antarctica TaxID=1577474 RepID=A0A1G6I0U9_9ACTN|nr:alanine racemase [Raineyella antarctica]SDC00081.1 alanine racemase [Raineyella antarctica]